MAGGQAKEILKLAPASVLPVRRGWEVVTSKWRWSAGGME